MNPIDNSIVMLSKILPVHKLQLALLTTGFYIVKNYPANLKLNFKFAGYDKAVTLKMFLNKSLQTANNDLVFGYIFIFSAIN